jgi:Cu+-exporting ATPase
MRMLFVVSVVLTVPVAIGHMLMIYPLSDPWVQLVLTTPVQFVVGSVFYEGAYRALKGRNANMDVLIMIGSTTAYVYSLWMLTGFGMVGGGEHMHQVYFETSAMLITFIFLGRLLEETAKDRTRDSLKKLMGLQPMMARILVARKGKAKGKGDEEKKQDIEGPVCDEEKCGVDHAKAEEEALKALDIGDACAKPDGAIRYREKTVPVGIVRIGDLFVVKPGERLPLDGVVVDGSAEVDESVLTGESRPVRKDCGKEVFAGTFCMNGTLRVKVTKLIGDTALRAIVKAVEEAQGSKAPIQRYADRVSNVFVPAVLGIALATFLFWLSFGSMFDVGDVLTFAILTAVATLIIACPCAMGLATPTAIMVGTGKGAEHGILIKGGAPLEAMAHIDTVVFDKTGTLTVGKQKVTDIITPDGAVDRDVVMLAASVEKGSEHSIGKAMIERAEADGIELHEVKDFIAAPGLGVKGKVSIGGKDVDVLVGNLDYMSQTGLDTKGLSMKAGELMAQGKTVIFVAQGTDVLGLMAIADVLKPGAGEVVRALRELGIETVMLTGDDERTAKAIAKKAGIATVMAGVMPVDKARKVKKIQKKGRVVAMVGDGINDAPALAQADVGIAIGSGTDIAIESADIVLTNDDLRGVVGAVRLSRKTFSKIKQNLFWALIYNVAAIPIAMGALWPLLHQGLRPEIAAFAMAMSDVCVVGNSLTLRGFDPLK